MALHDFESAPGVAGLQRTRSTPAMPVGIATMAAISSTA